MDERRIIINGREFEPFLKNPKRLRVVNLNLICMEDLFHEGWKLVCGDFPSIEELEKRFEIRKWLDENLTGFYVNPSTSVFLFNNEEDAIAFKLRWL